MSQTLEMTMLIPRNQESEIREKVRTHKLLVVKGPVSSGKRTILNTALSELDPVIIDLAEKKQRAEIAADLTARIPENRITVIHQAEYIPELQTFIEEMLVSERSFNLVLSFSFEPEIDEVLQEVLSMNQLEMFVYPPCFQELARFQGIAELDRLLEERLIFGSYARTVTAPEYAPGYLETILELVVRTQLGAERINKSDQLMRLLQQLAFRIGEPVSYNEIGELCDLDNETVERYIDLFEKAFVLIRLPSFYNEHRYELKKGHLVYFTDNGIRNALIRNFNPVNFRNDMDVLWKNWLVAERVKWLRLNGTKAELFFWRTHTRQQMDYIEVYGDKLMAYKADWQKRKTPRFPAAFVKAYPQARTGVLNRATYWNFLSRK